MSLITPDARHAIVQFLSEDATYQALVAGLPEDLAAELDALYQGGVLVYELAHIAAAERQAHPERFNTPLPAVEVLVPRPDKLVAIFNTGSQTFVADNLTREEYAARFLTTYQGPYQLPE